MVEVNCLLGLWNLDSRLSYMLCTSLTSCMMVIVASENRLFSSPKTFIFGSVIHVSVMPFEMCQESSALQVDRTVRTRSHSGPVLPPSLPGH